MADPSRRLHERLPCDIPVTLHSLSSEQLIGQARFVDIGLGGAAVETSGTLRRGVPYEARWTWEGRALRAAARVSWEGRNQEKGALKRFGLLFTLTTDQEQQLRAMVDAVRLRLWS